MSGKQPFEAVVAAHGATVLRVCRAVLGADEAEDAWSETFLSALTAYPDLPAGANVEAWLVTIAHRRAIDAHRSRARRASPTAEPDAALPTGAATAPPADHRDLDLADALAALPTRQKLAVVYHHLAGLPYAQVAVVLGGTEAAARRAGADGIATLRRTYPRHPVAGDTAGGTR